MEVMNTNITIYGSAHTALNGNTKRNNILLYETENIVEIN